MPNINSSILDYLGMLSGIGKIIYDYVKNRVEKRKFYRVYFNEIKDKLGSYEKAFESVLSLTDDITPLLDVIEDRPNYSQLNRLFLYSIDALEGHSNVLKQLYELALTCKEITMIDSLMNDLKKYDKFLLDFTSSMGSIIKNKKTLEVSDKFFTFLSYHGQEILEELETSFEESSEDISILVNKVNKSVIPYLHPNMMSRHTKQYAIRKGKLISKNLIGINIHNPDNIDYSRYIPKNMLQTIKILQEIIISNKKVSSKKVYTRD